MDAAGIFDRRANKILRYHPRQDTQGLGGYARFYEQHGTTTRVQQRERELVFCVRAGPVLFFSDSMFCEIDKAQFIRLL